MVALNVTAESLGDWLPARSVSGEWPAEQSAFWKNELAGAPTKLELPTDKPRPAVQSQRHATELFTLRGGTLERLKSLGRDERATLFMTLGAGFMLLLNRYTGEDDILVGTPVFASTMNTVVLRARFDDGMPFRSFLRRVREASLDAFAHSDVPFELLVAELVTERDPSHAPIRQVMFDAERANGPSHVTGTLECDLAMSVSETANGLEGSISYDTDLFEARTIQRMGEHYAALLEAISRDPDQSIHAMPMLTERERNQILYEWNDTRVEVPETCAHRLFEQQVARCPDAPALLFEGRTLSYRELNDRANQMANYLRNRGVGPEVLVGVCLERSPELVIALLGVWKAGGAYVPMDARNPAERLSYMLKDAAAKVLVTDVGHRRAFPSEDIETVLIDADWPRIERESTNDLESAVAPSNLAYVMYTSGSTGRPKGVMVLHRGLVDYLCWAAKAYGADSGDSVPVHSSIAFDLTVTALYVPLVAGGRIELLREDVAGQNLVAALRRGKGRSLVKITPAHLGALGEQLGPNALDGATNLFVIGGENLLAESLLPWRDHAPATRLINEYGPTETVVGCCVYEVGTDDPRSGSVPIGRPIANTQLYVLDRHMNPLPPGLVGELYIGGARVARGYLNRPELTEERFLVDPFSKESGTRMYKTGDLVRYRWDGVLEYLGRIDHQVKVRGYRVELGEIEASLAEHPGVKSCAVLAREDTPRNRQLIGYVVAQNERPSANDLRRSLGETLPDYMIPVQFVFLDSMPLTTNGKVDRQALPAPSREVASRPEDHVAARTDTETKLVSIWRKLLSVEDIGTNDNFFHLGGQSLQAIKVASHIYEVFGVDVSTQAVFDDPTIAGLARTITELTGPTAMAGEVAKTAVRKGPFFFGEPQLFGVYHPAPPESRGETALLVCSPIGHEYTRAHRAVALLCDAAARAGLPALRFDYTGIGDSSGDLAVARVDVWCNDVARAIDALLGRSGARVVHIVGLRLGAALAAAALARAGARAALSVKSLCLWDPLVTGEDFLRVASPLGERFLHDPWRFTRGTLRRRSAKQGSVGDTLLGYTFPKALRRSLEQLDLRGAETWPSVPIRVVLSEASARWADVATRLEALGTLVGSERVAGADGKWLDYAQHERPLRAGPVISRIVDVLAEAR